MTTSKVLRSTNGQYFVRVVAQSNGAILAHSETYVSKNDALNAARLISGGGGVEDLT